MAAPVEATSAQIRSWLQTSGFLLGANQFTYSIPGTNATWVGYAAGSEPFNSSYAAPTTALANGFRAAIAAWDELVAPNFTQVVENGSTFGELRVAFTNVGNSYGYAYSGSPQTPGRQPGDVWISPTATNDSFVAGDYSYMAVLHEVGHTLGLKHSFEAPAAPTQYDNYRYTIMSYTPAETAVRFTAAGSGGVQSFSASVLATTPMVLDIAAVQAIYGPSTTTRTGDTVYTFSPLSPTLQTLFDSGGKDTIDASNFSVPSYIDLRPGAYSSIGVQTLADQIAYWSAMFPNSASFIRQTLTNQADLFQYTDNVGIAFGTIIENATGGSGNDSLFGNDVANLLIGNAGNDTLTGAAGDDTLIGGAGNDVYGVDSLGDVIVEGRGGGTTDVVYAAASYTLGADAEIEQFAGATAVSTVGLALTGNAFGQAIAGTYGNDTISGGGATINGGDILIGLRGDDLYYVDALSTLIIENPGEGTDTAIILASASNFILNAASGYVEILTAAPGTAAINITGNALSQTINGNDGPNLLSTGGGLPDTLNGGLGDDTYRLYGGADVIIDTGGTDVIFTSGSYRLNAGPAIETISTAVQMGTEAIDLAGNETAQTIIGNYGNNLLDGRGGNDTLTGLNGADTFAFTTALGANNVDTIRDFVSGTDRIGLASDVFAAVTSGGILATEFVSGTAATTSDTRLIYDQATGRLFYDADANGTVAPVLFAQLAANTALNASDFTVVATLVT